MEKVGVEMKNLWLRIFFVGSDSPTVIKNPSTAQFEIESAYIGCKFEICGIKNGFWRLSCQIANFRYFAGISDFHIVGGFGVQQVRQSR